MSTPLARLAGQTSTNLLLLSVLGYPVIGVVTSYYTVESSDFAIYFRASVVLYAAFAITLGLTTLPKRTLSFFPPAVTTFVILYSVRIIADAMSGQFPGIGTDSLYFYGTCVIPPMAMCVLVRYRDAKRDAPLFLILGGVICAAILFMSLTGITGIYDPRNEIQGRLTLGRLNPISIGHVGATTVIAAIALFFERGHTLRLRWLALPIAGLALSCMVLAASRGPVVSLVGAIMALLVFLRRWGLLAMLAVVALIAAINTSNFQGELLQRLLAIGVDGSSMARLDIQSLALDQFLAHPITGSAYVELITGFYPHNIILDAAMSLGVVGLALMLYILTTAVVATARHMRSGEMMLPLLTVQYLLAVQFSGAIVNSAEFWAAFALILAQWRTRQKAPPPAAGP